MLHQSTNSYFEINDCIVNKVLVMPLNNTVSFKLIFWITLIHLSYDSLPFN